MAKRQSKRELKDLRDLQRERIQAGVTVRKIDALASAWHSLCKFGAIAICAAGFWWAVGGFAGKTTIANVSGLEEFFKSGSGIISALAVGISCGAGGTAFYTNRRRKKIHKDDIERLTPRANELERRLDPNRSSSQLDNRGETPKEAR